MRGDYVAVCIYQFPLLYLTRISMRCPTKRRTALATETNYGTVNQGYAPLETYTIPQVILYLLPPDILQYLHQFTGTIIKMRCFRHPHSVHLTVL